MSALSLRRFSTSCILCAYHEIISHNGDADGANASDAETDKGVFTCGKTDIPMGPIDVSFRYYITWDVDY